MTEQVRRIEKLAIDEFVRLAADQRIEFVDGEIMVLAPTMLPHSIVTRTLFLLLYTFVSERRLGEVFQETTFILIAQSSWVKGARSPDVMFYEAQRYADFFTTVSKSSTTPITIAPDLAVEVVSPTDSYSDLTEKIAQYLRDGVREVWVADPDKKTFTTYTPVGSKRFEDGTFNGSLVFPELTFQIAKVFEGLPG
jgi:Uma2 family endonuclease